jgi:hypothetical protein
MAFPPLIDPSRWVGSMHVSKYNRNTVLGVQHDLNNGIEPVYGDFVKFGVDPDEVTDEYYNQLVTVGLNLLGNLLIGAGGNAFTHAQAIVGVGNSSTAWTAADTHLGGDGSTTTAWYQGADSSPSSYPIQSNGVITCNATVATGNANWAWNEWCFATGSGTLTPGGTLASVATGVVMINHKIASLGTKVNTAVWVAQGTITES